MIEQKIIVSDKRQAFATEVNLALQQGWRIAPGPGSNEKVSRP